MIPRVCREALPEDLTLTSPSRLLVWPYLSLPPVQVGWIQGFLRPPLSQVGWWWQGWKWLLTVDRGCAKLRLF